MCIRVYVYAQVHAVVRARLKGWNKFLLREGRTPFWLKRRESWIFRRSSPASKCLAVIIPKDARPFYLLRIGLSIVRIVPFCSTRARVTLLSRLILYSLRTRVLVRCEPWNFSRAAARYNFEFSGGFTSVSSLYKHSILSATQTAIRNARFVTLTDVSHKRFTFAWHSFASR